MTLERPFQPSIRSLLYVPGNKFDWMLKSPKYGADALIFDLEDSVPDDQKAQSREKVRKAVNELYQTTRTRLDVGPGYVDIDRQHASCAAVQKPSAPYVQAPKIEG